MIILLGAQGYVGSYFAAYLRALGQHVKTVSRAEFDYSNRTLLTQFLKEHRPDFLINAAGYTGKPNVDACELAKADTLLGNTVLPLRIGEVCAELSLPWGHISSGCIYQGHRGLDATGQPLGFREEDAPNFSFQTGNCSFYSGTKALAEDFLQKNYPQAYIWRLRVPFDHRDSARNYLSKLLRYTRLMNARNSLSHLDDFTRTCWATWEKKLPFGIYNMTNPGSVLTTEVVELIQAEGQRRALQGDAFSAAHFGKKFGWFASEAEFMELAAKTPRSSCVLDTTKVEQYKLPLRPIHEALVDSLQRWEWEKK